MQLNVIQLHIIIIKLIDVYTAVISSLLVICVASCKSEVGSLSPMRSVTSTNTDRAICQRGINAARSEGSHSA